MLLINRMNFNQTDIINQSLNSNVAVFAEELKNITKSKVMLWLELKNEQFKGYQFKRQVPFYKYKIDFYCNDLKLVIEIEKNENRLKEKRLEYMGFNVLKFTTNDVFYDLEKVLKTIENYINKYEFKKKLKKQVLYRN